MSDVVIYGMPQSTYVRTCRMACHEKGIDYELVPLFPQSPEMLALNPTGQLPAFRHGDVNLVETGAIVRYIDDVFPGPKLQPADRLERAEMDLWMSVIADRFYQTSIKDIVLPRLGFIEKSDEEIQAAGQVLDTQLDRINKTLEQRPYLAGGDISLADLYLAPILHWVEATPEGKAALPKHAALGRWYQKIGERSSCRDTVPPPPGG